MCNTCGCKKAEDTFEAEGPRILNIKNVKYVGDSMDIKIELDQGGKKHMYQGVLKKGSGCDKCGSEVMAQWERKGQIMDLCKECYLMHFYNAETFEAEMTCPPATKDVAINTKNRNATIKEYGYGPLNVDEPDDFWEEIAKQWETSVDAAKKSKCGNCVAFDRSPRMKDCMPGETSDGEGVLGYCWMHHFKCHSARTCDTWAKGGPITTDKISEGWQERAFAKPKASKIATEAGKATAKASETYETNELIEIDGYNPLRAEKYMDMVLFYVGDRADLRYSHDRKGRPTTERQLLGNSPNYRSVINPLGIRMNDIDIVMNSGLPEIMQKEWDGKYILFDEGGTFTTGKPVNYFDSTIEYKYAESFEADLDVWSPEKEAIEQIKRSQKLLEEFPMISYDSRWNPDKVNEWSPERQVIDEIRGNPMYEVEFPYLGSHPGYYDNEGNWVERYNPELYGIEPELEIPWWIQLGIGIGSVTGLTYLLTKMSK
tara:strand:- start:1529 stop:2986 length:1458 start_codon:yes stop_codon:yes gene_type:complete